MAFGKVLAICSGLLLIASGIVLVVIGVMHNNFFTVSAYTSYTFLMPNQS
jgi:hypothetical protein